MKKIVLFSLFAFFCWQIIYATDEVKIYPKDFPNGKTIDFGLVYEANWKNSSFIFEYNGVEELMIDNGEPTIIVFEHPLNQSFLKEYLSFNPDEDLVIFPKYMDINRKKIEIPFKFQSGYNQYGWYHARVQLGLVRRSDRSIVYLDTFTLKAKKTSHYIDGLRDSLNFDSVYVRPALAKKMKWTVKSIIKDGIAVIGDRVEYLSPTISKKEFDADNFDVTPIFTKKGQEITWDINYSPENQGADSAFYFIYYNKSFKDTTNKQDTVVKDSAKVKMLGIGVEQELQLISSNYKFSGDTIYLGNVPGGFRTEIRGTLKNIGNIPFIAKSEKGLANILNDSSKIISVKEKAFGLKKLIPDDTAKFVLNCFVEDLGIFVERYVIESDILDRNIFGVPSEKVNKTIYIKGIGSAPKLRLPADTIDFGTVVINDVYCPSEKDTTIIISNTGNTDLLIKSMDLIPDVKFKLGQDYFELKPGQDGFLKIVFNASDGQYGTFYSTIKFTTSDSREYFLVLKVKGIPREASILLLPKIKAKPGRIVDFPIIVEDKYKQHFIQAAKNFTTEINFDSTLLRFDNRVNIGTASEGADILIEKINSGKYKFIINNGSDYFFPLDTLLILQFKTYLGEINSTSIAFKESETKFGDDLCDDVLNIEGNILNGEFMLDSVCGLDSKTRKLPPSKFGIIQISPNPADGEMEMTFNVAFKTMVLIKLYDINGNEISTLTKSIFDEGVHNISIITNSLPKGSYFVSMEAGIYKVHKKINIER